MTGYDAGPKFCTITNAKSYRNEYDTETTLRIGYHSGFRVAEIRNLDVDENAERGRNGDHYRSWKDG
jgi:hypothetical protein